MILEIIYYFLPAYMANSVPTMISKVKFLDHPLDFGLSIRGKRFLGDNKTLRGFFSAIIFGTFVFYIQQALYSNNFLQSISLVDYANTSLWLGFWLSFGAIFGDAIGSFFKRRAGVPSGKSWFPWDQLDFSIGALLFSSFIFLPSAQTIIFILIISTVLTIVFRYLGYLVGINKVKF